MCCLMRSAAAAIQTDASIYQIEPLGVVVAERPRGHRDGDRRSRARRACRSCRAAAAPRNAARRSTAPSSLDCSKYMQGVVSLDVEARRVKVQPGIVMERLNAQLRQHKLWFPVDVSTGDRATIGGMTANNSCGARSIRYGNMVHNVRAIDAILADGTQAHFGELPGNFGEDVQPERYRCPGARHAGTASPRSRRDRRPLSEAAAQGRRLQHRHDQR